jgi:hypothetical protein
MTLASHRAHGGRLTLRRNSTRYADLTLELNAPYLTFRHGRTCEVYRLAGGEPELVACSRESFRDFDLFAHVRDVAIAYAKLVSRRRK